MFKILRIGALGERTILDIYSMDDEIDYNPDYQRVGNIWDIGRRQLLIDSIINGYDLPKFYFHFIVSYDNDLNNSGKGFAVIDGKQRLGAIKDFMNGRINLSANFTYLNNPEIDLKGKSYNYLAQYYPEIKAIFDNYVLDIVFVKTDEQERLEELFLRLNEGEPLNNAEKRNAIGGHLIRKLVTIVNENEFFLEKVKFNNNRYEHQDILAKLLLLEKDNGFTSFTKKSLDNLIHENKELNKNTEAIIEEVLLGLSLMNEIFVDKDPLLRTKSVVPLYYWFIKSWKTQKDVLRDFLDQFESLRKENRKLSEGTNPMLIQFDRLNQQGANQRNSLEKRFKLLNIYFDIYLSEGVLSVERIVDLEGFLDDPREEML